VTNAAADILAPTLAPWRNLADEIVLAIDDRLSPVEIGRLTSLADRVITVGFEHLEQSLAAVHAACAGDWVMRIDSDEVPSAALLNEFPALLQHPTARQWALPRRWLFPDAGHWLDEVPWWPDYQFRLVRNDSELQFSGLMHSGPEPVLPAGCAYNPIYHLDCIARDAEERFRKALLYEVSRPELVAPHGLPMHRYYLPEDGYRRRPVAVPEADRPAIDALLARL
jgi:hypothetical protein